MTATRPYSYGNRFNRAGGGIYATQIENQTINIWHWPREEIPKDILRGQPKPSTWGIPLGNMHQRNGGCDVDKNFHTLTIVSPNMPYSAA